MLDQLSRIAQVVDNELYEEYESSARDRMVSRHNWTNVLKDAATLYKVDTEAIGQKVKQEFAAKARAKKEAKPEGKA